MYLKSLDKLLGLHQIARYPFLVGEKSPQFRGFLDMLRFSAGYSVTGSLTAYLICLND